MAFVLFVAGHSVQRGAPPPPSQDVSLGPRGRVLGRRQSPPRPERGPRLSTLCAARALAFPSARPVPPAPAPSGTNSPGHLLLLPGSGGGLAPGLWDGTGTQDMLLLPMPTEMLLLASRGVPRPVLWLSQSHFPALSHLPKISLLAREGSQWPGEHDLCLQSSGGQPFIPDPSGWEIRVASREPGPEVGPRKDLGNPDGLLTPLSPVLCH